MAAEQQPTASAFDMTPHQQTWSAFCKLMKYGIIGVAIVLAGMAYFLT